MAKETSSAGLVNIVTILNAVDCLESANSGSIRQYIYADSKFPLTAKLRGMVNNNLLSTVKNDNPTSAIIWDYNLTPKGEKYLIRDEEDIMSPITLKKAFKTSDSKAEKQDALFPAPLTKETYDKALPASRKPKKGDVMDQLGIGSLGKVIEETTQMMTFLQRLRSQLADFIDEEEELEDE